MSSVRRAARLLLPAAVAGALALATSRPTRGQAPQGQPRPTFRAGVNFVQVDVYPTADGRPVADLSKDDFEVLEDGVPQAVATFEHVSIRPEADPAARIEPRSLTEANDLAADPHNRLFVLFLDSYHVTDPTASHNGRVRMPGSIADGRRPAGRKPLGPGPIDKAIVNFLERAIGPNDLVAPMSPEMDARHMVFTRRPERFADWVVSAWAHRYSWDDLDPEEERWAFCYPPSEADDPWGCYAGIFEEMVLRRREGLTLRALDDTVTKLGQVREGRKAVLLVSEGWALYRSNSNLARALPPHSTKGCPAQAPPPTPGVYVGPGGKPQFGADPKNTGGADLHDCDVERQRLAMTDDESDYKRLLDRANRETVSFYPVDPRGLAVFDTPLDAQAPGPIGTPSRATAAADDMTRLRGRLDALRNLASATDGFMAESNDLSASLKRVADDLADYYLLGYNSTNARLDGKFRRISVRVKRPGVQVRARRGYLAATQADVAAATAAEAPIDPGVRARESALAALGATTIDRGVRLAAGFDWGTDATARLWALAELGEAAARGDDWREGGEVQLTVTGAEGATVGTARGPIALSARVFTWQADGAPLAPGEYLVRVTARSASGGGTASEQLRVTLPAASTGSMRAGSPRLSRRGPATGLAFVPTADARFRRVERVRVTVSLAGEPGDVEARLLDRRGQALGVPVAAAVRDQGGVKVASAEASLAPLAAGDYLVEITLGGASSRQIILTAIRIIP